MITVIRSKIDFHKSLFLFFISCSTHATDVIYASVAADECYPYTSGGGVTGNCLITSSPTCAALGGTGTFQLYNAASAYSVGTTVAAIATEILTNGPIEVAFDVYQDFFSYTSGVYVHKTGSLAGGHAVKMIGWGTLSGVAYWTVSNSWGLLPFL